MPRNSTRLDDEARFWAKVDKTEGQGPNGDCWEWKAFCHPLGYGQIKFDGRTQLAHRIAYKLTVGPIPEGMEIDHVCRNKKCVRHLEAVTHQLNTYRRDEYLRERPNCENGHPWAEFTGQTKEGRRFCRRCRYLAVQKSQKARMARDPEFARQMKNRWRKYYKHKRVRAVQELPS